jgi:hypothetical protein
MVEGRRRLLRWLACSGLIEQVDVREMFKALAVERLATERMRCDPRSV